MIPSKGENNIYRPQNLYRTSQIQETDLQLSHWEASLPQKKKDEMTTEKRTPDATYDRFLVDMVIEFFILNPNYSMVGRIFLAHHQSSIIQRSQI